MGEAVPIAFAGEGDERFAAIVIAEYFGQQMGREVSLVPGGSNEECLDMLRSGVAPMAVLDGRPDGSILKGAVVIDPVLVVDGQVRVLVMGEAAVRQLQLSLVPMYMEKLKSVLTDADWENGLARVRSGEGIRKAAIDMLRGKDLI